VVGHATLVNAEMATFLQAHAKEYRLKHPIKTVTLFVNLVSDHLPGIVGANAWLHLEACNQILTRHYQYLVSD
jgi:hypothetical protein